MEQNNIDHPKTENDNPKQDEGRNKKTRSNTVLRELGIDSAIDLLLQGIQNKHIVEYLITQKGFDRYDANAMVRDARELIKQSSIFDREEEMGKAKRRLENLYYKFFKGDDYKSCLLTQREITELIGLKETIIKNINIDAGKLDEEERQRIKKELHLLKED